MKLADILEMEFSFDTARKGAQEHKSPMPKFQWDRQYGEWFVFDADSYDDASDSNMKQHGQGKTKAEALDDLYGQLLDSEVYPKDILDRAVKDELAGETNETQ